MIQFLQYYSLQKTGIHVNIKEKTLIWVIIHTDIAQMYHLKKGFYTVSSPKVEKLY